MRVSIITPVFNGVEFIEACVENVLAQGDVVLEHIIVDGGSSDGTLEMVEKLQAQHSHISLISGPDAGQSDAMNKGSETAVAEIIGLLNVDDFYEEGAVRRAADALKDMDSKGVVVGDCRILGAGDILLRWNKPSDLRIENLLRHDEAFPIPANPSAYFYHREVHEIVGGYDVDNHYAMDVDFMLSCARLVPMKYVSQHWGNFRLIPGCKSYENLGGVDPVAPLLRKHRKLIPLGRRINMSLVSMTNRGRVIRWKLARLIGLR